MSSDRPEHHDHHYVFDNDDSYAEEQHRCLVELLDPFTIQRLTELDIPEGWQCLEVGGGSGSIARWLADQVGPSGDVLVTDIKPSRLKPGGNIRVQRHDVVHDPLPVAEFDLFHIRAVLFHLPERRAVLARLARALRPGGWIQIDDFDLTCWPALRIADSADRRVYEEFQVALCRMFEEAGSDLRWGHQIAQAMHDTGFNDINPGICTEVWRPGMAGTNLLFNHTFQLRDQLVAAGFDDRRLAIMREILRNREFLAMSFGMYSVHGRR
jgi:ubiquinone/menaquinone biosynthesis C-methylase UbiE